MFKPRPSQPNPQNGSFTPEANHYRPSVPISIYRELASELQAAQTQLATLKSENQQLLTQNQLLRREVEKVLEGMKNLEKWTTTQDAYGRPITAQNSGSEAVAEARRDHATGGGGFPLYDPDNPDDLIMEIAEEPDLRPQSSEKSMDVSIWLVCIVIALTVLTAFGIGFLYVRSNNNNN
ncbi:hypothetical protein K4A83_07070 [Spirulina subsalsa FACHB-351]|uniref:Uncharacterized protein n=1 Tax=Spirulina subsalsa FACHB-351 TaxID=234711 RepID=A0ABT3L3E7_9CYAN|nr:hypothetical protein [Spirulina subsalsa]MCW6036033.1 hypothetical protein [Spirulina subsalsa FACHB-351]